VISTASVSNGLASVQDSVLGAVQAVQGWISGTVCYFISCSSESSLAEQAPNSIRQPAGQIPNNNQISNINNRSSTSTIKTIYVAMPVNASRPTQLSTQIPAVSGNSGSDLTPAEVDARIQTALEKALGAQAQYAGQNVTYAPVYQQISNQADSIALFTISSSII